MPTATQETTRTKLEKRLKSILADAQRRGARIAGFNEEIALAQQEGRRGDAAALARRVVADRNRLEELEAEMILIEEQLDDEELDDALEGHIAEQQALLDDVKHWRSEALRTGDPTVTAVAARKMAAYSGMEGIAATGATSPDELESARIADAAADLARQKSKPFRDAVEAKRGTSGTYDL